MALRGDALPADDRGLHYGDGLFETIWSCARAACVFWKRTWHGLSRGCARLRNPLRGDAGVARGNRARPVAQAPAQAILKVIVTRGSAVRRGYAPAGTEAARRLLSLWPARARCPRRPAVRDLCMSRHRLAENPALAGIKHLNRLENVLAAAGVGDGTAFRCRCMLDASGRVVSRRHEQRVHRARRTVY